MWLMQPEMISQEWIHFHNSFPVLVLQFGPWLGVPGAGVGVRFGVICRVGCLDPRSALSHGGNPHNSSRNWSREWNPLMLWNHPCLGLEPGWKCHLHLPGPLSPGVPWAGGSANRGSALPKSSQSSQNPFRAPKILSVLGWCLFRAT